MWLSCTNRCGGRLFRAVLAEVDIDAVGNYAGHRITQPSYVCLNCGAPALDLGEVPVALAEEAREDEVPQALEVLCPMCETLVQMGADMECPSCGAPLEVL